ncbi:hypothetical protein GCM10010495_06650 [Kitasatospora herbaricolor]|uniref:SpoIIE family protein phosphatase n=1 Tax=Kitasatospora herbaricolor TaxID=68217 RepID=UPI00174CC045|nr:SpoIIE family protein phosphatase [Kitasatospora herbaricolor]MDQ0312131.1 hypothetical protein [Kitasatospora herbaricolor]GGU98480.1 hypothetical protein GCM10010495_06650 [Kitasatospora herbaricolor]
MPPPAAATRGPRPVAVITAGRVLLELAMASRRPGHLGEQHHLALYGATALIGVAAVLLARQRVRAQNRLIPARSVAEAVQLTPLRPVPERVGPCEITTRPLEPGDVIVLHPDGVSEARNTAGVCYPVLEQSAGRFAGRRLPDPELVAAFVRSDADCWSAGAEGEDDRALLALAVRPGRDDGRPRGGGGVRDERWVDDWEDEWDEGWDEGWAGRWDEGPDGTDARPDRAR